MLHLTNSFFPCVSLSTILALGACGGGGGKPDPEQKAVFSEASTDELMDVLQILILPELTFGAVPTLMVLEGEFSGNGCPEITETGIVGNCTTTDGVRYEGSVELAGNEAGPFVSMTYRGLRRTDPEGLFSFYLDGTVVFTQESDEELRYDLAMTVEISGFDAEVDRIEVEMSATCRTQDEGSASCTLEDGSAAQIAGFGGFTIEGTHPLGSGESSEGDTSSADLTAHGEDSVHITYDDETECMTYTLEGGEPQQFCPEE